MPHHRGLGALALLFTSVTVGRCVFPTERDSSVHVSITPLKILIRGNDTVATATAWQVRGPGDSVAIPNVAFVWTSSDPKIATVDNAGHITGVKSGTVDIRAAAANFDKDARSAVDTVRVAAPLEIDSVVPASARYGELITAFGPGADDVQLATMKGVQLLFPYPFSASRDSTGYGRKTFWLPPPAETDSIAFIGNGIVTFNHDTTHVVRRDVYEPNDTAPHHFNLDAPRPFPYPTSFLYYLLVVNPALFFEPLKRGETFGADWYRFRQSAARDLTVVITAPSVPGTFFTFVTDSLGWDVAKQNYVIGPDSWTFGPGSHDCHGLGFGPSEANGDSTVVAFKSLPDSVLHAIAIYTQSAPYGLTVWDAYVSELPPDAHEDDNSCNAADVRGTVTLPFRDTLAIENPHDIDWIRFHVGGVVATTVQFRLRALPGVHPDSLKDLDFYVLKAPNPGDTALQLVLADTATGSDVDRTALLAPGDYYAVVLDFQGTTTYYVVCAQPVISTTTCGSGPWPAPPPGATPTAGSATVQAAPAPPRAKHWPRRSRVTSQLAPLIRGRRP